MILSGSAMSIPLPLLCVAAEGLKMGTEFPLYWCKEGSTSSLMIQYGLDKLSPPPAWPLASALGPQLSSDQNQQSHLSFINHIELRP